MGRKKGRIKMPDDFISTGEAAKMLDIGRTTVNRYFAQGVLTGEQHPITNLRRINRASVLALMQKYGMKWQEPT
jgi:excisionase family DNA binding protein